MAEMDPEGDQLPPWGEFRFHTHELERWFDGQKRILTANVDYPRDAPFEEVKRRLMQAVHKRRGRGRVWYIDEDRVGILLVPPWS